MHLMHYLLQVVLIATTFAAAINATTPVYSQYIVPVMYVPRGVWIYTLIIYYY